MAKDPAFLFYYTNFSHGTRHMTFEEKGAYIELLCEQADQGHLSLKRIERILNGSFHIWDSICKKFILDENGNYYNQILEERLFERKRWVESRKNNLKSSHMVKHMDTHMENRNRNRDRDSKDKVKDKDNAMPFSDPALCDLIHKTVEQL